MNNYYVYIYWRLDTNEPFYVGKGKDDRWKILYNRKGHFKNIMNKYPIVCEIVKDNLTEEQSHGIECWIINELVFEYGYSIDIPNNRSIEKGNHLVNKTWGGDGTSGHNPLENKTEEEIAIINKKRLKTIDDKSEEEKKEIKQKISEKAKLRVGELNGMYGRNHSIISRKKMSEKHKGKKISEKTRRKMSSSHKGMKGVSRPYEENPNSKAVICLTTKKIFLCGKTGIEYYGIDKTGIVNCCKGRQKSAGKLPDGTKLVWMYLSEFLEKCKYVLL